MQDALSLNTTIPNAMLQCIRSASCDIAPLVPAKSHNVVVMSWFYVGAQRNIGPGVGGVAGILSDSVLSVSGDTETQGEKNQKAKHAPRWACTCTHQMEHLSDTGPVV